MLILSALAMSSSAKASDLDGAWANDASVCSKVFQKSGETITFTDNSDAYGSGFIIENQKIRGKIATCLIKKRKQNLDTIHLIADCSTDVALSTIELSFKIINYNSIIRIYPGVEELNISYKRCNFK